MAWESGHKLRQREDELNAFIGFLVEQGVRSYLEVGACYGDTFYRVVSALPAGSKAVAVDMVNGVWGKANSNVFLKAAVKQLCAEGYRASVIFGDSQSLAVRQLADTRGPYDAALIDGDHRLEGVTADWKNYGPMARLVAFHDIDGAGQKTRNYEVQVPLLWECLRQKHRHVEFIGKKRGMGIGVAFRE